MSAVRPLTVGEVDVLRMVQEEYGPQNTEANVFFTGANEAAIFVKARDGSIRMAIVLSNLARWRKDGTIPSDLVLRTEWLRVSGR